MENSLAAHQKVKLRVHMNSNPRRIYSSEIKTDIQIKTGICTFISVLFTLAPEWKQLKCPLTETWKSKMCHSHTMEEFIEQQRNEVLVHATAWMNPESIMFSDRIQPQKVTFKKFHFYEMSRIGKFMETESRLIVI